MIDSLTEMKEVDQTNVWKICQYLLRIVYFHYEASEKEKIYNVSGCLVQFTLRLFTHCVHVSIYGLTVLSVPLSWKMTSSWSIRRPSVMCLFYSYNECDDDLSKKQLCEVIAKVRLSHLLTSQTDPFSSILSSSYLSEWYEEAARQLDIASPRLPSSILSIPSDDRNVHLIILFDL